MRFCFFGGYDPAYQRNLVIRKGLRRLGDEVVECPASPRFKFWLRYPILLIKALKSMRAGRSRGEEPFCWFVPEFCHKDVPLARGLSILSGRPLVFDPLASRYETKILDRRRNSPGSIAAWWNRRIDGWSLRWPDLVLSDTGAHRDYYIRDFRAPAGKTAVLPLGYDDEVFNPGLFANPAAGERPFTVLFFGSFLPLHGAEAVVEAAGRVAGADNRVLFRFIGSGQTWEKTRAAAVSLGLDNCVFDGWLPVEDIPARIAASDICLGVFGRGEKARRVVPHKIFQSMGMKKAVVTARTPAVEEFFRHGENIFLCDEPYGDSLAEAVLRLKADADLREGIAAAGFRLVKEDYSPTSIARALKGLLAGCR